MSERSAGLLLPVFALKRERHLGIGDTRSMHEWIDLAADHGVRLLQLLPINETGSDDSPYNAISSVALDPVYLAMEDVPGVPAEVTEALSRKVGADLGRVDYGAARACKRGLLDAAWARWPEAEAALHGEFEAFRREEAGWLNDYCVYRTLVERTGTEAWDRWPEVWRTAAGARVVLAHGDDLPDFFAWVQWLCFRQWRAVRAKAEERGVRLMGDIPIGVSRNSADVFFGGADFDPEWFGGAPPETVFKHDEFIRKWGQNWGVPLYRWERMEREGFPWWRRRIAKLVDVFHVFRIDHVLGFYRIYGFPWPPERNDEFLPLTKEEARERTGGPLPGWVPRPDDTKANRAANRADGDRRLRMVLDAAGDAEVVGEDLGCVPDYVGPHLRSLGICGFRVPHWDFDETTGKVVPGGEIPACSFATYATHDHEPIPAMWEDFRTRAEGDAEDEDDQEESAAGLARLAGFAGIEDTGPFDEDKKWRLIDALMACNARHAVIMITDLFGMTERINAPGTVGAHNWSLFLERTAEECRNDPAWARLAESIRRSGRAG